jgi:hypothetical protein
LQFNDDYGVEILTLFNGPVTFGNSCEIADLDVGNLIDDAEPINELPSVTPKHVIEYKLIRESKKELRHIELFKQRKYFAPFHEID